jgi:urease accessory protein
MSIATNTETSSERNGPTLAISGVGFLTALQLSDTFFPAGLYTLSHGLESFAQAGVVSKANLEELLQDYLENILGPADGVALAHAHAATKGQDLRRLSEIDRRLFAMKLVRESRECSRRVGKRILGTAVKLSANPLLADYRALVNAGACPGNSAVALAAVTATFQIGRQEAMLMALYTFTASLLGAAMRLIRLDHEEAQLILTRLKPCMLRVVQENQEKDLQDMRAFAPFIDIMGMAHERARIRLFIS